jgi:hypothetical protein
VWRERWKVWCRGEKRVLISLTDKYTYIHTHTHTQVFFRAIAACPLSKTLWMDAFSSLSALFSEEEKKDMLKVMGSKGLVLRVDPPM